MLAVHEVVRDVGGDLVEEVQQRPIFAPFPDAKQYRLPMQARGRHEETLKEEDFSLSGCADGRFHPPQDRADVTLLPHQLQSHRQVAYKPGG